MKTAILVLVLAPLDLADFDSVSGCFWLVGSVMRSAQFDVVVRFRGCGPVATCSASLPSEGGHFGSVDNINGTHGSRSEAAQYRSLFKPPINFPTRSSRMLPSVIAGPGGCLGLAAIAHHTIKLVERGLKAGQ